MIPNDSALDLTEFTVYQQKKKLSSINKENGGAQDDKVTMPAKKSESTLHDEVIEVLPISIVIFLLHFFSFYFYF